MSSIIKISSFSLRKRSLCMQPTSILNRKDSFGRIFNRKISGNVNQGYLKDVSEYWRKVIDFFGPKEPSAALAVFEGKEESGLQFFCHGDFEYGGKSTANFEFLSKTKSCNKDFIKFSGTVAMAEGIYPKTMTSEKGSVKQKKAGFCALKVDIKHTLDLRDFEGLALEIRSEKNQMLIFNMSCDSYIEGEVFQLTLHLDGHSKWKTIHLPFEMFQLTIGGNMKEQDAVNDSLQLKSFGILVRNIEEEGGGVIAGGSFEIDIAGVQALKNLPMVGVSTN